MLTRAGCWPWSTKPMHHWQVVGIRFVQMGDHSLIRRWPVSRLKENFAFALAKCFFIIFSPRDRIPHDWEDLQSSYKRCRSVFLQASRLEKRKIKRPRAHLLLPFDTFSVLLTRRFARETNCRIDRIAMFRSIETHATRFILPSFLSLFSHFAYFLLFPPPKTIPLVLIFLTGTIVSSIP